MQEKFSKVRIADIAKRAQVSTGTVDRVIHNRGEVAAKTREKILKIIDEMNYEPDILASTLASKRTFRFASLIPEAGDGSQFWAMPSAGLEKALNQVKHFGVFHDVFHFQYFDRYSFRKAAEELLQTEPDGVILAPVFSELAEHFVAKCQEKRIPVVFINSNIFNIEKLSFVGQDSFRSGMVAAHLLDYGMPEGGSFLVINFMSEKGTNMHLLSREEGFRNYFSQFPERKKHLQTLNIVGSDMATIRKKLWENLMPGMAGQKIKGVFVTNSRVFHVANFLKTTGIKDIRLIGYDLLDENVAHLQENTIDFLISQKPFEQGLRSFMALFDALVLKKPVNKYQYLPIDIITRENIDYYINNLTNE
jgi:LacI family transcriptional regulator